MKVQGVAEDQQAVDIQQIGDHGRSSRNRLTSSRALPRQFFEPETGGRRPGCRGYYYRILTRQGDHVSGGRYSYVINGNMIAGFALVAFPAEYGQSGIMTFLVSHHGKVLQKDLGPKTHELAGQMKVFNPDGTWTEVKE
jgi:hypothetical protein